MARSPRKSPRSSSPKRSSAKPSPRSPIRSVFCKRASPTRISRSATTPRRATWSSRREPPAWLASCRIRPPFGRTWATRAFITFGKAGSRRRRGIIPGCRCWSTRAAFARRPSRPTLLREDDTLILCTDGWWGPLAGKLITRVLLKSDLMKAIPELLDLAELRGGADSDNLSVVAMTWAETHPGALTGAVSTQTLVLNGVSTQLEDFSQADDSDLSDEEIERAIEEIRAAIRKHMPQKL